MNPNQPYGQPPQPGPGQHGLHDPGDLGALALGLLDGAEARGVQMQMSGCPECRREFAALRETATLLESVPPEMFLEGPAESDLLVARAARQVRKESGGQRRRRTFALATAAVVSAAALLGGGVLVGRTTAEPVGIVAAAPADPGDPAATPVTLQGTEGDVVMAATVTPATGWVRVTTAVRGIPAGARCTIIVVGTDGSESIAGSWLASARGQTEGTTVNGSALVDPAQVSAVTIRDETGTDLITVSA